MKIALIRLPSTYANWYIRPTLGIAYIAACLKSSGYECKIFDAYAHSWSKSDLLEHIKEYDPDIVGLTAMTHEINQAAKVAALIKANRDIPMIIGGCHVTALPEKTMTEFPVFDYGIYGEGEKTILELLSRNIHEKGHVQSLHDINGLVFRDHQQIVVNEARPFLISEELDALPWPALDDYYTIDTQALANKESYYTIFASRGCPYNCAFCMQVLGRKVRWRSPDNIIREMNYAIKHYGAHTFDFADEIFLFGNQQTRDVLEAFIHQGFPGRIKWSALTRANFVTPELIALAKKAGCVRLGMGVESGDDEILKTIGKGISTDQIRKAVKIIKENGILLDAYYILGHPGETVETLKKTVNLAAELNTDSIAVGLMVPYPGTRIFDMAVNGQNGYRLLSRNWDEYDKYGGKVLEVKGLPYQYLLKWQRKMLLYFYLKNFRFLDCFRYFWIRRRAIYFIIKKKLIRL